MCVPWCPLPTNHGASSRKSNSEMENNLNGIPEPWMYLRANRWSLASQPCHGSSSLWSGVGPWSPSQSSKRRDECPWWWWWCVHSMKPLAIMDTSTIPLPFFPPGQRSPGLMCPLAQRISQTGVMEPLTAQFIHSVPGACI